MLLIELSMLIDFYAACFKNRAGKTGEMGKACSELCNKLSDLRRTKDLGSRTAKLLSC